MAEVGTGSRDYYYTISEPPNNLPCGRYTNEMHAHARSGRAKRAPLLVYHINDITVEISKHIMNIP